MQVARLSYCKINLTNNSLRPNVNVALMHATYTCCIRQGRRVGGGVRNFWGGTPCLFEDYITTYFAFQLWSEGLTHQDLIKSYGTVCRFKIIYYYIILEGYQGAHIFTRELQGNFF